MKGAARFVARRPLVLAAFAYVLGAAIGYVSGVPAILWCAGLLACPVVFALSRRAIWLFCALLFVGAWGCAAIKALPAPPPGEGLLAGRVCQVHELNEDRSVVTLDQASLDGQALDTRVRLYLYQQARLAPGDLVQCPASTWLPGGATNPGGFDFDTYLRRGGVRLCATAGEAQISPGKPSLEGLIDACRRGMAQGLDQLYQDQGAMARAMLLGDKQDLPEDVYTQYRDAGVAHLLAVSGLHVSCLAAVVCWALWKVGLSFRASYFGTLALIGFYVALVGAPPSAVRAALMFALVQGAPLDGSPYDLLTGLSAAALALVAVQPLYVGDAGFILSVGAVLGMDMLTAPIIKLMRVDKWKRGLVRKTGQSLSVSVAAQLGTLPAVCCMFGQITPYAPLTNLPALFLSTLALPLIGLSLLFYALWAPLGALVAIVPKACLLALQGITGWVAGLPGAVVYAPAWPWVLVALFAACALAASDYLALNKLAKGAALAMLPVTLALAMAVAYWQVPDGLNCVFLDAGQGDACVVTAQKKTYLMDVGDAGGPTLAYLRHTGRGIDGLFLSHGHVDHGGALTEILKERKVPVIYLPAGFERAGADPEVLAAIDLARRQGTAIRYLKRGDGVALSPGVTATVLAPEGDGAYSGNGVSMMVRVAYGQGAALFTGDLPTSAQSPYLAPASVLKAAHHGGADATDEFLLRAVAPAACVISVGRNSYGHPSPAVLERLNRLGIITVRTDQSGAITFQIGADGAMEMETFL